MAMSLLPAIFQNGMKPHRRRQRTETFPYLCLFSSSQQPGRKAEQGLNLPV